jgi:hypothetical protein
LLLTDEVDGCGHCARRTIKLQLNREGFSLEPITFAYFSGIFEESCLGPTIRLTQPKVKNQVRNSRFALWNITLYAFAHSNDQIDGVEEDRIAKPRRPLPSGRISPENPRVLYRVLFTLMWAAAFYTRTILCTLVYSVAIVVYNEWGLAKIPIVKNVIGAIGLACYCWGTTIILGMVFYRSRILVVVRAMLTMVQDRGRELHGLKAIAVFMIGAIFATTVSLRATIPPNS